MAQRTITTLIDDVDGSEAAETVAFSLDGTAYEIDVSEAHAEDLREVLSPYVSVARRAGSQAACRVPTSACATEGEPPRTVVYVT